MAILSAALLSSCAGGASGSTGWAYNDSENGGFQRFPYIGQETGLGLVFVEGGTFVTMGRVEDDLTGAWDNIPCRVTVSSFYMDEVEVTNPLLVRIPLLAGPRSRRRLPGNRDQARHPCVA